MILEKKMSTFTPRPPTFTTTGVPYKSPPNFAKSRVTAPSIGPLAYLLSLFQSGISSLSEILNIVDSIPGFNWQNQSDIDLYLNPATRKPINGKDLDFWASAKAKPWNAKSSNGDSTKSAYVGPVLNQGQNGICYAVSSTDVLTMRHSIQNDLDNSQGQQMFNVQQLVRCSSKQDVYDTSQNKACGIQNAACGGGFPACVGAYVQHNGVTKNECNLSIPIMADDCVNCAGTPDVVLSCKGTDYPIPKQQVALTLPNGQVELTNPVINYVQYYDDTGKLVNPKPPEQVTDTDRKQLQRYMKTHLITQGPMVVCFYVDESLSDKFMEYSGGVFTGSAQGIPNHAVTLVGWGTDPVAGPYWIVKNSWGTSWGDTNNPGYFNFAMSTNSVNAGYGLDYPQVSPSGNQCSTTSDCLGNSICIDGQCYYMYGGGTGFLVSGMEPIDVPQVQGLNPVDPNAGPNGPNGPNDVDSSSAISVPVSTSGYQGLAGAAFANIQHQNNKSMYPAEAVEQAMYKTYSGAGHLGQSSNGGRFGGSASSGVSVSKNNVGIGIGNVFVVDIPNQLATRHRDPSKKRNVNMKRLIQTYNHCIQNSPKMTDRGSFAQTPVVAPTAMAMTATNGNTGQATHSGQMGQTVASAESERVGLIAGISVVSVIAAIAIVLAIVFGLQARNNNGRSRY